MQNLLKFLKPAKLISSSASAFTSALRSCGKDPAPCTVSIVWSPFGPSEQPHGSLSWSPNDTEMYDIVHGIFIERATFLEGQMLVFWLIVIALWHKMLVFWSTVWPNDQIQGEHLLPRGSICSPLLPTSDAHDIVRDAWQIKRPLANQWHSTAMRYQPTYIGAASRKYGKLKLPKKIKQYYIGID